MTEQSGLGIDQERSTASSRAEAFVQKVVVDVFGQRASQAAVTAIAKRILAVLPEEPPMTFQHGTDDYEPPSPFEGETGEGLGITDPEELEELAQPVEPQELRKALDEFEQALHAWPFDLSREAAARAALVRLFHPEGS